MYMEHIPNIVLNIVVVEARPKIPQLIICSFSPSQSMLKALYFKTIAFTNIDEDILLFLFAP
jgi:hypothetical protein